MKRLRKLIHQEPAVLGGAILATVDIWHPSAPVHAAIVAWVTLYVRSLSTPTRRAEDRARQAAADAAQVARVEAYHEGANDLAELARAKRRKP